MRYPPQTLDEIRARLPVSHVVGKRVRLKKAGREWKGLSPFNAEKSPSFFVNDQKSFYHCFSSGKHGDIFTFLMETEGLSFPEAVERLAADAGVPLPKATAEDRVEEVRRRSLHEVMELAAAFYEGALQGRPGARARDYLSGRALAPETQRRFRIGYAPPDRFALRDHLASKDVPVETMVEAGLLVTGEDVAVPYDRFRDRVMFPICDLRGRAIAFGGRALSADVPAKYLNSPDTPLFSKGRLLYNFDKARKPAHERGTVLAVEGYVDVISLSAVGFGNVVAPLGTALTEEQLTLLWRLAEEPVLCFDGDKAGRRAAYRALDVALPHLTPGRALRFALLPEGQDPDDLARSGGSAAVDRVLAAARPLVDVLWARETEAGPIETPDQRAGLERRLRDAVALIRDDTLKRYYWDEFRSRLYGLRSAGAPSATERKSRFAAQVQGPKVGLLSRPVTVGSVLKQSHVFAPAVASSPREAVIVCALLAHANLLSIHAELLSGLEWEGREAHLVSGVLLDSVADGSFDPVVLDARLARAGLTAAALRLAACVRPGDTWMLEAHADPSRLEDALRQAIILHRKARALHSELMLAQRAYAEDETETNLAWLCDVQGQISSLDGAEADAGDGLLRQSIGGGA